MNEMQSDSIKIVRKTVLGFELIQVTFREGLLHSVGLQTFFKLWKKVNYE